MQLDDIYLVDHQTANQCQCHRKVLPQEDTTTSDRKSTRLNSSHGHISYAVFCLKIKNSRDGKVFLNKAYCIANVECDIPATMTLRFRIRAASNHFTPTAMLLLAQRDKLTADAMV